MLFKIAQKSNRIARGATIMFNCLLLTVAVCAMVNAAPTISGVSTASATRSGRVVITGTGFGANQNTVTVQIGGINAPRVLNTDTEIVAYVPETAAIGAGSVQVITAEGASNAVSINVTNRPPQTGRVKWRFELASAYALYRAAIAADGTIYVYDVGGSLYAIQPDGGLKWIYNVASAGAGYDLSPPSVGQDGTIYIAASLPSGGGMFNAGIIAVNPNGTQKWTFSQNVNDSNSILAGPMVGPDGNIYAVPRFGIGVFSLTPAGALRWSRGRFNNLPNLGREMFFDQARGQFYFQMSMNAILPQGRIFAYDFDGNERFSDSTTQGGQPVVAPLSGNIYTTAFPTNIGWQTRAYSPNGNVLWNFRGILTNSFSFPSAGPDDAVYTVENLSNLYALNPNGSPRWLVQNPGILDAPIINPPGNLVVNGGIVTYGEGGYFLGTNADGSFRWRVDLPDENGAGEYGQVRPISTARFTPDGNTAYIATEIAGVSSNEDRSYFYAIDARSDAPVVPPTAQITSPTNNQTFTTPTGAITVRANASDADGTIQHVDFYVFRGSYSFLGRDGSAPFETTWQSPSVGDYVLIAQATDNDGNVSANSPAVNVRINDGGLLPLPADPATITSPTNGQTFPAGGTVQINANTSNIGHSITRIDFYANENLIGSDNSFPYQYTWTNTPAGTYNLRARTIANNRSPRDSAPVQITLQPAATVIISGRITNAQGQGIGTTVLLTLTGGNLTQPLQARATPAGYFRFEAPAGFTYTVTPVPDERTFTPVSRQVTLSTQNIFGIDFITQ